MAGTRRGGCGHTAAESSTTRRLSDTPTRAPIYTQHVGRDRILNVLDSGDSLRLVVLGVFALLSAATLVAWLPGIRFDPTGVPARIFMALGAGIMISDFDGVGAVLGLCLALMGALMWWEGQPPPEVPRPLLLGVLLATLATGIAMLAALDGWSAFGRIPEEARPAVAVGIGAAGLLGTLAVADRSRVRLRDAIRRRFTPVETVEDGETAELFLPQQLSEPDLEPAPTEEPVSIER